MHLSAWPSDAEVPGIDPILARLSTIYPSADVQTHLLHLASVRHVMHLDLEAWVRATHARRPSPIGRRNSTTRR